jgi:molybdate transport system substrate-binding protein
MAGVAKRTRHISAAILFVCGSAGNAQAANGVEIYAAGSLRGVVAELSRESAAQLGTEVKGTFGGSGLLRERIEGGEKPDLFLSADLGSPHKLEIAGRTLVPVIPFARNRMCVVSRSGSGVTAANLIDRLLDPHVRVKTSTPVADPGGDYAWAIFDRIELQRPGAGAVLKQKAQALMSATAPATPTQSPAAALFVAGGIDVSITYCSGAATLQQELPQLMSLLVPADLDPHPVYGLAVLSAKPEAWRVALFLLSQRGQAIIAHNGLVPLMDAIGVAP